MVTHDSGIAGADILIASPKDRKTIRWEEIRRHNNEQSPWLVINGKVYDVTEFQTRHPGGDMILLGAGRHATELFLSHHPSKVIESNMLDKYYIGDVEEEPTQVKAKSHQIDMKTGLNMAHLYAPSSQTDFYSVLRHRIEDYFKKNNIKPRDSPEMYIKTFLSLTVWFILLLGTHYLFDSIILSSICAVLWGFANANIGMSVMHDGNHGGYSDSPIINRIMGGTFDFLGGSSFVWKMIHSVGHHVHTNVEEIDPDIHTAEPHFRKIKGIQKHHWWYRYQHIYLPFMYSILLFELFARDFIAMLKGSWGGVPFQPAPRREWIIFWSTKAWFVTNFFLGPYFYHGDLMRVVLLNCVALLIAGELLVLMFQVNHVTQAATSFHADSNGVVAKDWAISQVEGSSNFASGSWLWNHISGGLNHQTEHHLFPTISHVHYPKIHPIVKKTCEEYGVSYNSYPTFFDAIKGHFGLLMDMGAAGVKYDYHVE
jgi:fatty acid desaturase/predicted heme/steroid binding protein